MIAKVVSTKMKNTAVVEVERFFVHPIYKKRLKRTTRFHAHDSLGVKEGEKVRIETMRPLAKNKYHRIVEVIAGTSIESKSKMARVAKKEKK